MMVAAIPKMAAKDQIIFRLSIAWKVSRLAFLPNSDSPPIPRRAAPTSLVVAGSTAVHPKRVMVQIGAINNGIPNK